MLHNDFIIELPMTKMVLRDTDTEYKQLPGYAQNLQIDPLGNYLYTGRGLLMLAEDFKNATESKDESPYLKMHFDVITI